jgi:dolichyl-diphosphooligosaccharide--protein glycosyltransferase
MAIATIQHRRFEYYFAVNFALLSGVTVSWVFSTFGSDVLSYLQGIYQNRTISSQGLPDTDEKEKTPDRKKSHKKASVKKVSGKKNKSRRDQLNSTTLLKIFAVSLTVLFAVLFVVYTVNNDLAYADNPKQFMTEPSWVETLLWLKDNTPPTGVDYFGVYNKGIFTYPKEAYGVMAWWDYGHYISFISERIPNTNPFQDNLEGSGGAAAFFIAQDEDNAVDILYHSGSRFIITDTNIVSQKFHAIASWYNSSAGISPYRWWFYFPDKDNANQLNAIAFNTREYYRTMIVRLHLNEGSFTSPTTAYYIEFMQSPDLRYPKVVASEEIEVSAGLQKAALYNSHALPGTGAAVLSSQVMYSLEELPALHHFRLVHDSTADSSGVYAESSDPRLRAIPMIKVFELVKGARIPGEGTIEVDIITNTGREFTYRQKSENGEFIVPYSTTGSTWEVKTKGNYRMVETGKEVAISEEDVKEGRTVG